MGQETRRLHDEQGYVRPSLTHYAFSVAAIAILRIIPVDCAGLIRQARAGEALQSHRRHVAQPRDRRGGELAFERPGR